MNKYFIQLFLRENTVILPGFGALTAPNGNVEEIMFVPYLTTDDGKLADFIAETEGVDRQDAQNTIAKFIREMEANLSKGESFDIFQFGSFFKNETGDVEFKSWLKAESNKPTVHIDEKIDAELEVTEEHEPVLKMTKNQVVPLVSVSETVSEIEKELAPEIPAPESKLEEEAITFGTEENPGLFVTESSVQELKKKNRFGVGFWILNALLLCLIAGAIYTYFNYDQLKQKIPFLSKDENVAQEKTIKILPNKDSLNVDTIPQKEVAKINAPISSKEKKKVKPATIEKQPSSTILSQDSKGYFLIGGAFGSENQAQKKIDQLQKENIEAKIFPQNNASVYVSLGEFTDQSAANNKLIELRDKGLKVWVLKK